MNLDHYPNATSAFLWGILAGFIITAGVLGWLGYAVIRDMQAQLAEMQTDVKGMHSSIRTIEHAFDIALHLKTEDAPSGREP